MLKPHRKTSKSTKQKVNQDKKRMQEIERGYYSEVKKEAKPKKRSGWVVL